LQKKIKKTRKTRKQNALIVYKKTLDTTLYMLWDEYRKTKEIREISRKEIGIKESKKYYKIETEEILEKTRY
jgi:hypothetical protein